MADNVEKEVQEILQHIKTLFNPNLKKDVMRLLSREKNLNGTVLKKLKILLKKYNVSTSKIQKMNSSDLLTNNVRTVDKVPTQQLKYIEELPPEILRKYKYIPFDKRMEEKQNIDSDLVKNDKLDFSMPEQNHDHHALQIFEPTVKSAMVKTVKDLSEDVVYDYAYNGPQKFYKHLNDPTFLTMAIEYANFTTSPAAGPLHQIANDVTDEFFSESKYFDSSSIQMGIIDAVSNRLAKHPNEIFYTPEISPFLIQNILPHLPKSSPVRKQLQKEYSNITLPISQTNFFPESTDFSVPKVYSSHPILDHYLMGLSNSRVPAHKKMEETMSDFKHELAVHGTTADEIINSASRTLQYLSETLDTNKNSRRFLKIAENLLQTTFSNLNSFIPDPSHADFVKDAMISFSYEVIGNYYNVIQECQKFQNESK